MIVTEKLVGVLKAHQAKKPELHGKNVRVKISGEELNQDSFSIGFDSSAIGEADQVIELDELKVVVDGHTATLLREATLDIGQDGISIRFND